MFKEQVDKKICTKLIYIVLQTSGQSSQNKSLLTTTNVQDHMKHLKVLAGEMKRMMNFPVFA